MKIFEVIFLHYYFPETSDFVCKLYVIKLYYSNKLHK